MEKPKSESGQGKPALSARDQRLAKALRDNLRRRKAQPAAAESTQTPPSDDPAAGETD